MDTRILKYFITVAQEENITKAAEILHTSQPNLSRQLADLENEIGRKLFDRGNRRIQLTEEGMFLYKRAQEIIELLERTETELSSFDDLVTGDVYIGAAETHAMRMVAHQIQAIRDVYPQVLFHIFSNSTVEVTEQLDKGLLDFGIVVDPVNPKKYNHLTLPAADTWGVLMHRDSPLAKQKTVRPEDMRDKPLLCAEQMLDANEISTWIGEDFKNLNVVTTFNLITTPAMMIEEGLGYTFTFDKLVNTSGNSKLCFRPLEPQFKTGLYLIWKKYQIFTKAGNIFLEHMKEVCKQPQ